MAVDHAIWWPSQIASLFLLGDYQYDSLPSADAVRILNLERSDDFESPLCGYITWHQPALEASDPNACSWYSAVSYTWGNEPKLSHKLFLRRLDHETMRPVYGNTKLTLLPITYNVSLLLRHLRDVHKHTRLWIDSVCINQRDQEEKARQIPLMSQIYAHAKRVHIWLGDDEIEGAREAFSLVRRIEVGEWSTETGQFDLLCLHRFFNRPWFTRRWVIQEIFFAHNAIFHCGHLTISLSSVMAVLFKAEGLGFNAQQLGRGSRMLTSSVGLGHMQAHTQGQVQRRGLLSLLWDLHESECSDKRDRIAALYTLANDHERAPLHYDIGDWRRMYMKIASYYLNNTPDTAHAALLHLGNFGSIESTTIFKVPSWVPNWSTTRHERQVWENSLGRISSIRSNRINKPWAWIGMVHLATYSWSRHHFSFNLRPGMKQWSGSPNPSTEVSAHCLRLQYDFLTFIYRCGIVDQVVCPALSNDFWEEVVRPVERHRIKDPFKKSGLHDQANQRHQVEVESLSWLLVSVLAGKRCRWDDFEEPIITMCEGLCSGLGHKRKSQLLTPTQKKLLRKIRSTMKGLVFLRVQTTIGYHWAVGPLDLVEGDWLTPIIPLGKRTPCSKPCVQLTQFVALRPTGKGGQGNTWYPSPTSEPEGRLRRLWGLLKAKVESVHVNAQFAGHGASCIPFFDYSTLPHSMVMWRTFLQAVESAERRNLPGPVVFDIV